MKSRALNILSSALIALSAFFFASGLSWAEEESLHVTQPVTITAVLGKVEVLAKDTLVWKEAEEGAGLFEGDKIKTGIDGKAQLTLNDGSYVKLKEETTLGIKTAREETADQASQYELDFRVGEIMVELKKLKKGSSFKVETPTAVAAVRGTTYYMRTGTKIVDGVEKSYVELYVDSDDTVLFTNTVSGESCIACQGQGAIVYDDGTIEGPFPIPPEEQDAWKSGFDMIYDDSGGKKGMRYVDQEGSGTGDDDTGEDVDDTSSDQDDAQDDANQDQSGEQDITGLAKVTIITDSDKDGVPDSEDLFPNDPNRASGNDADGDEIDDEFDEDDNDGPLGDLDGDGVINAEDNFPNDPNRASGNDADGDEIDDEFDEDDDNDGVADGDDAFPKDPSEWLDSDSDNIGDNADNDDDNDGVWDTHEALGGTNSLNQDTDGDTFNDFEDAFPKDNRVDWDTAFGKGYGSWEELHQAAVDALAIENLFELKQDISDMINDMHARGYEALKEEICDHQAGKVMTDRWGNRVRVEEYISKPTNDQVQILALNLRTAGPNAGISSMDFRVRFSEGTDISNTDLKTLPWDDYMDNPLLLGFVGPQLILYKNDDGKYYNPRDYDYPTPEEFSLEVKNPYSDSVKFIETYRSLCVFKNPWNQNVWYSGQIQKGEETHINGDKKRLKNTYGNWGRGWNTENQYTFLERYRDGSWLMGLLYLIDDNGGPVEVGPDKDGISRINGIRDLINPDYNLEMVFLSSEFPGTNPGLPETIEGNPDYADEKEIYNNNRTIDVITIPEITTPYKDF